ncbi:cytidylyltransferase domain-containing protein [Candidatus Clostridium helianthi]|jgi:CMP-N-acetylneuraminic acid synthetase|uniref:Cytidylyltransferase domain-containing protein n=1 Tax=Candidatus Clostridium helianthi TaxID=3381660 RepID=A0ABW8S5B1_9CLOT
MKIVAFVPIKMNNERLPNKNTKCFDDGTPLIKFILNTLKRITEIDEIYVFCSNPKIKEYLPKGIGYIQRSEILDTPTATPQDIIKEFKSKIDSDIYVVSHATSPFVSHNNISKCINKVLGGEYDSAFTANKIQSLLWKNDKPLNFDASRIPRTQDLTPIYSEVSAAYVFRKEVFEKYNRRIGIKPYICEVSKIESVDIDNFEDFEIANALYMSLLKKEV